MNSFSSYSYSAIIENGLRSTTLVLLQLIFLYLCVVVEVCNVIPCFNNDSGYCRYVVSWYVVNCDEKT